ncbi:LLM class F420-dependent oxidoreductase [Pseudonocardia sp. CA-107938]|uniref:LLM class F420-dependent oxidoreductase n=1 Tax=Pseudonocardia sp. CA-107938 TaxID=3240021 RepID=UPI003D8CCE9F
MASTPVLGRYGIWQSAADLTPEVAQEIERAGFGTVWIGSSPPADLDLPERLIAATDRLTVATGIVNMWATDAAEVAKSYQRIEERHPGRFLLGVGIGHPEATAAYRDPYRTIVEYLDVLDAAGVPQEHLALAALGPKVLKLAAERTGVVHPYLVTPEYTREARALLGPDAVLAPEQKVVLETDVEQARALARGRVANPYLHLRNYIANLKRLGWSDADLAPDGSDALIDALVAHGDAETAVRGLTAHLDAGADHVCAQVVVPQGADLVPPIRALGAALPR